MDKHTPSKPTVADIFRIGFEAYNKQYGPLPYEYYKIAHAITNCRTEELGGHLYQCNDCGHEQVLYNSCRNRHCPQCQSNARIRWVKERIDEVLPVGYFHVVFTIPDILNPFALRNKKTFYSLMFRAVKETLIELAQDTKRLGAQVGFICVLHTWGQTLVDHPHIHVIIPAGGLAFTQKKWIHCKKKFLFPVPVMQKLFQGKMIAFFKEAVDKGSIGFYGSLTRYLNNNLFNNLLHVLYKKKWVVFIKEAFATPESVIKYLGNYTHRIAISNRRILKITNDTVTFLYKDYNDNNKRKQMTLSIVEFIRRLMLHALPGGFMRIRHFGFFANRNRKIRLPIIMKLLKRKQKNKTTQQKQWQEIITELTGHDLTTCPKCRKGKMKCIEEIPKSKFRKVA